MKILKILKYPNKILTEKSNNVNIINNNIIITIKNMKNTMFYHGGIGIAAPQIGIKKNIIIVSVSNKNFQTLTLINPIILYKKGFLSGKEGCLSFPKLFINVKRNKLIKIKFLDIKNNLKYIKVNKLLSICLQHEIDHLFGITLYNKMSGLRKKIFLKNTKWLD